jgi:hypothetical protein
MKKEREIGDSVYLKELVKGYRYVEIAGFDGVRIIVRTISGYEFSIYEDELEDES